MPRASGNAGHGSANEDEVVNLCRFIEAVQAYTHSRKIDIVAHSLGVTLARDVMRRYPALARDVVAFVGIAGGNDGTTICRGLETSYYGCNEVAPDSPWLAWLNGPRGSRETPGPTRWMTTYNGSAGDPYFDPPYDEASRLREAVNVAFPGEYHNDLRVDPAEVDTYLPFLLRVGQAGPYAVRGAAELARRITRTQPDGLEGRDLGGIPKMRGPAMRFPEDKTRVQALSRPKQGGFHPPGNLQCGFTIMHSRNSHSPNSPSSSSMRLGQSSPQSAVGGGQCSSASCKTSSHAPFRGRDHEDGDLAPPVVGVHGYMDDELDVVHILEVIPAVSLGGRDLVKLQEASRANRDRQLACLTSSTGPLQPPLAARPHKVLQSGPSLIAGAGRHHGAHDRIHRRRSPLRLGA